MLTYPGSTLKTTSSSRATNPPPPPIHRYAPLFSKKRAWTWSPPEDPWGRDDLAPSSRTRNRKETLPSIRQSWTTHNFESETPPSPLLELLNHGYKLSRRGKERKMASHILTPEIKEGMLSLWLVVRREDFFVSRMIVPLICKVKFENLRYYNSAKTSLNVNWNIENNWGIYVLFKLYCDEDCKSTFFQWRLDCTKLKHITQAGD